MSASAALTEDPLLPNHISTVTEMRDKKIDLLPPGFQKGPVRTDKGTEKGENSLCMLVKTNTERFLCLWGLALRDSLKCVEKCPHSRLTAVRPEMMGARALPAVMIGSNLIFC